MLFCAVIAWGIVASILTHHALPRIKLAYAPDLDAIRAQEDNDFAIEKLKLSFGFGPVNCHVISLMR